MIITSSLAEKRTTSATTIVHILQKTDVKGAMSAYGA
jgi:hypothetical protein